MELPHDNPWHGYTDFNLNSQVSGAAASGQRGDARSGSCRPPQVRKFNCASTASTARFGSQAPQFGSYLWLEALQQRISRPAHSRRQRRKHLQEGAAAHQLASRNGNAAQYMADGWSKSTNASENNWSDFDHLFQRSQSDCPPAPITIRHVSADRNVDQWVRWFAAMELLNSRETNLQQRRRRRLPDVSPASLIRDLFSCRTIWIRFSARG